MTRREVRDCAFKIVFEQLLRNDDVEELFEIADEVDEITVDDQVRGLVLGVVEHAEELDAIIGKYSKSRALLPPCLPQAWIQTISSPRRIPSSVR